MADYDRPRDQERFARLPRPLPELHGEEPPAAGLFIEVRDGVDLVDVLLVGMEVLREVEFLVDDGLALDGEVIRGVERVDQHVHVLARELVLLEPVREALDVAGNKEPVQAVDDLPLEVAHRVPVGRCSIYYVDSSGPRWIARRNFPGRGISGIVPGLPEHFSEFFSGFFRGISFRRNFLQPVNFPGTRPAPGTGELPGS